MKITVKVRLCAIISILSIVSLSIGVLGLYGMNKANNGMKSVYENRTVALERISRIDRLQLQSQLALAEAIQDSMAATIKIKSEAIDKYVAEMDKTFAEYMAGNLSPKERELAQNFSVAHTRLLKDGLLPAIAAMRDGKLADAGTLNDQLLTFVPAVRQSMDALRQLQVDDAKTAYLQSSAESHALESAIVTAIVLSTGIALVLGILFIRSFYRQLGGEPEYASSIVHSIAAGILTDVVVTSEKDRQSLLFAMKNMQQSLAKTVGEIRRSTDTMASASREIASGNRDLSSRTEHQANSLQETASSMEQLTGTVKQNAENSHQANQLAQAASEVALKGGAVVSQVVDTMGAINESARKIGDIISVIDSIAFQTNILALNAAVEAARAGEQGRGFAVVAAEVRTLAQRSAAAAREIKTLIDASMQTVDAGSKLVKQAGATMNEVVDSIHSVTDIMTSITAAAHEQSQGILHVNQAIAEMDNVTQQNTALVKEAAVATASLQEQAANLAEVVSVFQVHAVHIPINTDTSTRPKPATLTMMKRVANQ